MFEFVSPETMKLATQMVFQNVQNSFPNLVDSDSDMLLYQKSIDLLNKLRILMVGRVVALT